MKKVFILFLMLCSLLPFYSNKIEVFAKESHSNKCNVYNNNSISYDVNIEDKIVEFNKEICISFVLNDEINNYTVSLINASFIPINRIIEQNEKIDVYVLNNHEVGEHKFDVTVQTEYGLSITQAIYIYSDGIRDCVSSSCIEESKDIYFCNFIASHEELVILGREEEPKGMSYTTTYYDVITKYEEFIYKKGDISCVATRMKDDIDGKLKISGTIKWLDSANNLHPLINNYVYLFDNDVLIDDIYGYTQTNDNGEFTFTINNSTWLENGGLDLFIMLSASNDATFVTNFWTIYTYTSPIFENVSDNSVMNYEITINPNDSNSRANSFEISQMMYYSHKYVKEMSEISIPDLKVIYPSSNDGSYYNIFFKDMYLAKAAYDFWDVGMHEYGHYIDDYFDLASSEDGKHWFDGDMAYVYKKKKGLRLAYSEAIASYLGISAQLYLNLSNTKIPYVGDYYYNAYNGVEHDGLKESFGESDEGGILGLLLTLADDVSYRYYDKVSLGYKVIWNILDAKRRDNASDLISDIINEYPELTNEIGLLLERFGFAPQMLISSNKLNLTNTNNTFSWSANRTVSETVSELDKYSLRFYSNNLKDTYQIDNITSTSYTLTSTDLNNILSLSGSTIYWQVIGYNTRDFLTGPYNSSLKSMTKPTAINIYLDNYYNYSISKNESIWYKFVAPQKGTYEFETTGSCDTYGELFTSMVANGTILNRLENGYNDDSGEGTNFKIKYDLEYNQVVYLRVRGYNYNAVDEFTLSVICTHHDHKFEYKSLDSQYHILKCHCGETSGNKSMHLIDGTYVDPVGNGRYKPCVYCGVSIDTWAGGIHPVLGNNDQVAYVIFENRIHDDKLLSTVSDISYDIDSNKKIQYTLNGSYKLDDGTIILVEKDLDAFLNGTLHFYNLENVNQI